MKLEKITYPCLAILLTLALGGCGNSPSLGGSDPNAGGKPVNVAGTAKEKAPPPPGDPTPFKGLPIEKLQITVVNATKFARVVKSLDNYTFRGQTLGVGEALAQMQLWDAYCLGSDLANAPARDLEILSVRKISDMNFDAQNLTPTTVSLDLGDRFVAIGATPTNVGPTVIVNCMLNSKIGAEVRAISVGDVQAALAGILEIKVK